MATRQADSRRFEDRRDRPSRDRREPRHRDDRYRDHYEGDSYRRRSRSRSPAHRRRDRSRDNFRDYRDRDRHYGRDRDEYRGPARDRDRDRDRERDRDRDRDRGKDRGHDSYRRGSRSASLTPGPDAKRIKLDDRAARDEKPKADHKDSTPSKDAEKDSKLARLEKWKQMQAEKKAKKEAEAKQHSSSDVVMTDAASSSPKPTEKAAQEAPKVEAQAAPGQQPQAQPAVQSQPQPVPEADATKANVQVRLGNFKMQTDKKSNPLNAFAADDAKLNSRGKNSLLQDDDAGKKSKLVKLDEWEGVQAEKMDTAEDIDPLDAFMEGLDTAAPANDSAPQRGEAMFGEDTEPDFLQPVGDDLFSIVAKKKKKDVPVVDHSKVTYEPFRKAFYTEPSEISEMTPEEVADLRLELDGIKVKPADLPRPVIKWAQMGLSSPTIGVLQEIGYAKPTSIQAQAIPIVLSGRDMIGVAKTGSGKTLAFGIPIIRHVCDQPPLKSLDGPIALILAPTRELSLQIVAELKPFLKASNLTITCAYGGAPIADQIASIKRGVHVLCATPGRLIDLLQVNGGRALRLNRITYVVIDEADRMFDMGFGPQVMKVLNNVRPDRQTLLFSATFPRNMADLARKTLTNPAEVIIGGLSVVAPEITQIITIVPPNSPEKKMEEVLLRLGQVLNDEDEDARALIFVERQEMAEEMLSRCTKRGYPCNTIHGAKDQSDRTDAINDFKNGAIPLLIATSVAARGLDVLQLKLVINYDCPTHLEDYVHRCGRTGRAGNKGTAVTLIENPGQERFAVHICKALRQSGQPIPEELKKMSDEFMKKVKEGTEKWFDPGFGGKGLDKLDAARALEKKREKRAHKGELFDDDSDSEPEMLPTVVNNTAATPAADTPTAAEPKEESWMQILKNKIVVNKTERPSAESSKPMTPMEKVKAIAQSVNGRLSKKGMIHHGQPIDNKGPDAGAFHSTIEINDFPQKARWAVTNRTNVAKILEQTGTSITTKGTYYAPGTEPKTETDLPKLYILVEGDTENVVQLAMIEITRLLKEATLSADEGAPRGPTGRYSVM